MHLFKHSSFCGTAVVSLASLIMTTASIMAAPEKPTTSDVTTNVASPVILPSAFSSRLPGLRGSIGRSHGTGSHGAGSTEFAVLISLRWLKKYQEPDGSWDTKSGGGPGDNYPSTPAMTGLALLAYLGHGETPASEEFGPTIQRAISWLVQNQQKDGRFPKRDGNDYSHPIATYALCEAFGMTQAATAKEAAKKAVDVIIKGQHASGAWNYNCDASDRNDTSYSSWCVQALKAAKIVGLDNDGLDMALAKAVQGFKLNFQNGVFAYETKGDVADGRLTSAAVLCLQLLGAGKSAEARSGMDWLNRNATCDWSNPWGSMPMYYWYYLTQAKFHTGGEVWNKWNAQFSIQLVKHQIVIAGAGMEGKDIGYWEGLDAQCKAYVYNTTLCTLMLEVYYRYRPAFLPPVAGKPAQGYDEQALALMAD